VLCSGGVLDKTKAALLKCGFLVYRLKALCIMRRSQRHTPNDLHCLDVTVSGALFIIATISFLV